MHDILTLNKMLLSNIYTRSYDTFTFHPHIAENGWYILQAYESAPILD